MTHLGYATSLGFLLSLSRERLHTVADPTGRQCVWPAPGTTQAPGESLHRWHLQLLLSLGLMAVSV